MSRQPSSGIPVDPTVHADVRAPRAAATMGNDATQTAPPESKTSSDITDQPAIIAGPARYYRMTRYLMVVLVVGFGLWCVKDGFFAWPQHKIANDAAIAHNQPLPFPADKGHTVTDIKFNKWLGVVLPVLGILLLLWALHQSRDAYRLEGQTLHIPGHPPIPLDAIRVIDKTRWDTKRYAWIEYDAPDGTVGRAKIDDFIYDEKPTGAILKRLEAYLGAEPDA